MLTYLFIIFPKVAKGKSCGYLQDGPWVEGEIVKEKMRRFGRNQVLSTDLHSITF